MNNKLKKKLQRDQFAEKLIGIAPNVSEKDKSDCKEFYKYSQVTVWRYLNGQGVDPSIAYNIYTFLLAKIEERNKVLA